MKLPPSLHAADNFLVRNLFSPKIDVRPARSVVTFTFDDIPASAASMGAAILEHNGVRGTFYLAGQLIIEGDDKGFADMQACRRLAENGHELACHTFSHHGLRNMTAAAAAADLKRNAEFFNEIRPGLRSSNFAYPFNKAVVSNLTALRSRFRTARGGRQGINRGASPAYQLSAIEIAQPEAPDLDQWLDNVASDPGWLIYFTHDVSPNPSRYGARPETLGRLVRRALDLGHEVLTVDAALDRFSAAPRPRDQ